MLNRWRLFTCISYVPSWVKGQHFYLYMIVDIYSRKIVAAEVFSKESGQYAAELLQRAVWNEKCSSRNLVLHSDNGEPMRSCTLLDKMYALGVLSSYFRPRVSNDNPYSESLFRTIKYCPWWPENGFRTIDEGKRAARTVLTGMCYSVGSATRQGSSSPTRFIGQSAMTSRT
ncbi:transposase family protein [Escherichia coli]|nr:transposase family protein [Escherichia coli]